MCFTPWTIYSCYMASLTASMLCCYLPSNSVNSSPFEPLITVTDHKAITVCVLCVVCVYVCVSVGGLGGCPCPELLEQDMSVSKLI